MAKFKKHPVKDRSKLLVVSDPGGGKTGLLATIANAGFKLRIIDADNGLDILNSYLTKEGAENTNYITLQDDPVRRVSAWGQFIKIINEGWKDGDDDLGKLQDWGDDTVLVIDTMNFLGKAAMRATLSQAGKKLDDQPTLPEWGETARKIEQAISRLTSNEFKCNVIVNTHLRGVSDDFGRTKFYPASVGEKLCLDIGGYFNTIVRIDMKVNKSSGESRVIRTTSDVKMNLKTAAPDKFQAEEEFDLARLIRKIQGRE